MEKELMPDYAAEEFYRYLIPRSAFGGSVEPKKKTDHCVVFCKKVAPNVFDIRKGIAVVAGTKEYFNDGLCMIAPSAKVVFVIE